MSTTYDISQLIQYGVLGLMVVGFLIGWIWAKPAVDRLTADKEKAEAQRDELIKAFAEQVIPVLDEVATRVVPVLNELRDDVKEMKARGQ